MDAAPMAAISIAKLLGSFTMNFFATGAILAGFSSGQAVSE